MLELPDIEILRENLASRTSERMVREVRLLWDGLLGSGSSPVSALLGQRVHTFVRKGALLALATERGAHLVIDLAPWAWMWHGASAHAATRTTALVIGLDDGNDTRIIVPGPRRTAQVWLADDPMDVPLWAGLGPDPLDEEFTWEAFRKALRAGRRRVKEILTDPRVAPGIGDAYADEVLYRVAISPLRYSHTLTADEGQALWRAVPDTLSRAIEALRERTQGELFEKEIRDFLQLHGKAAMPCPRCSTPIAELRYDDRVTHYCPRCQRGAPRA